MRIVGIGRYEEKYGEGRFEAIDALRGIGALAVALMHVYYMLGVSQDAPFLNVIMQHLGAGVQLFFIVSAFTLCLTYEHKAENRVVSYFLIKRYFRIAPLFYLCVITTYVVLTIKGIEVYHYTPVSIFTNATFIFNLIPSVDAALSLTGAGWTIGVEFLFYFLFPAFVLLLRWPMWLGITFGVSLIVAIGIRANTSDPYLQLYCFLGHLPTFLSGMLLYRVWKALPAAADYAYARNVFATASGIIFFVVSLVIICAPPPAWSMHLCWSGAFLFLTLSVLLRRNRLIANSASVYLGRISYSLYLLHPIVIWIVSSWFGRQLISPTVRTLIVYISVFGILLPWAALSHRFLEAPSNSIARRLIARISSRETKSRDARKAVVTTSP